MDFGFQGMGGIALDATQSEQVAIGSPTPPELSGGVESKLPQTATVLFWIALGYLVVYVFHVVTY